MLSSVRPVRSLSIQRMPNPRSDTYPADSFADGTGSGPGPTRFNRPHLISCKHIHHVSRQRASPPADLAVRGRDGCTRFAHPNHPGGRAEHPSTSPTRSGCAASRTRRRRRPKQSPQRAVRSPASPQAGQQQPSCTPAPVPRTLQPRTLQPRATPPVPLHPGPVHPSTAAPRHPAPVTRHRPRSTAPQRSGHTAHAAGGSQRTVTAKR